MIHIDDFGRSPNISRDILQKIKKGNISQVSVMLGFVDKKVHLQLKKTGIPFRLHLNLTEQVERFSKNFSSMTFLSLIFANNSKKLCVKEEIDRQLKRVHAHLRVKRS